MADNDIGAMTEAEIKGTITAMRAELDRRDELRSVQKLHDRLVRNMQIGANADLLIRVLNVEHTCDGKDDLDLWSDNYATCPRCRLRHAQDDDSDADVEFTLTVAIDSLAFRLTPAVVEAACVDARAAVRQLRSDETVEPAKKTRRKR
jgi:hypothetical protein